MMPHTTLSSAAVILQYAAGSLYITLSSRTDASAGSTWELPSSPVFPSHTSISSLAYTLEQTIGLKDEDISYREQLYTTENVFEQHTSARIAYLCLTRDARWHKGTQQAGLFPIDKLPALKDSDKMIIRYALDRLHAKTLYSSIIGFLLPKVFDLTQLQQAFETITRQTVDRRNFRKKILSLGMLYEAVSADRTDSPRSPARYALRSQELTLLDTPFRMQPAQPTPRSKQPKKQPRQ